MYMLPKKTVTIAANKEISITDDCPKENCQHPGHVSLAKCLFYTRRQMHCVGVSPENATEAQPLLRWHETYRNECDVEGCTWYQHKWKVIWAIWKVPGPLMNGVELFCEKQGEGHDEITGRTADIKAKLILIEKLDKSIGQEA